MTSLQEAIELLEKLGDGVPFSQSEVTDKLVEFGKELDHTGTALLSKYSDDELVSMSVLLQSIVFMQLVARGEDFAQVLMIHSQLMTAKYCAMMMKLAIGLAAQEEIR